MNPYVGSCKQTESEEHGEDTDFEKSMTQERERLKTSQIEETDKNDKISEEVELPDLVDASGHKAPSQLAEEEAAKKAKSEALYPEDEDPDPAELVRTEVGVSSCIQYRDRK